MRVSRMVWPFGKNNEAFLSTLGASMTISGLRARWCEIVSMFEQVSYKGPDDLPSSAPKRTIRP